MTSLLPAEAAPYGASQPGLPPDAGVDRVPKPDVAARLAALRAALAAAEGYLDPALLARASEVADHAEARLGLSGGATVVALAGATGSGTSALFNALAGLDLSPVGVLRPTTDEPLSCTWGDPGAAAAVQDWLGVPPARRIVRASALDDAGPNPLDGLVLLDLPDHDSVRESHRREVDRLVERVDLLVWVLDPQKYADRAVHERYLRRLAGYDEVVVVVLNQVDRLASDEAAACLADLRRLLAADGLPHVPVLPVSARAGLGVAELRALLAGRVAGRRAAAERWTADLAAVARPLRDACGEDGPSEVDAAAAAALVTALGAAAGGCALAAATAAAYRHRAGRATGWPPLQLARRWRRDPLRWHLPEARSVPRTGVATAVRALADAAAAGLPDGWTQGVRRAADGVVLADALDRAVAGIDLGLARHPRWWRVAAWVQGVLAGLALVGAGWLVAVGVLGWLRPPPPAPPAVGAVPFPAALLVGAVALGWLVAGLARVVAAAAAQARRRRVETALQAVVAEVAERCLLAPVRAVLAARRTALAAARRAAS